MTIPMLDHFFTTSMCARFCQHIQSATHTASVGFIKLPCDRIVCVILPATYMCCGCSRWHSPINLDEICQNNGALQAMCWPPTFGYLAALGDLSRYKTIVVMFCMRAAATASLVRICDSPCAASQLEKASKQISCEGGAASCEGGYTRR